MYTHIKFKNTKINRAALLERGYEIHDPAHTFARKAWMIFSDDAPHYILGVDHRVKRREVSIEEFDRLVKDQFLVDIVNHPRILDLSTEDKESILEILNKTQ